jgi:hypothetical protein
MLMPAIRTPVAPVPQEKYDVSGNKFLTGT